MECEEEPCASDEATGIGDQLKAADILVMNSSDYPGKVLLKTEESLPNARDGTASLAETGHGRSSA